MEKNWFGRESTASLLELNDFEWLQSDPHYPNQVVFPALTLAITMFAFNSLGDALRDALDPRLRGT